MLIYGRQTTFYEIFEEIEDICNEKGLSIYEICDSQRVWEEAELIIFMKSNKYGNEIGLTDEFSYYLSYRLEVVLDYVKNI